MSLRRQELALSLVMALTACTESLTTPEKLPRAPSLTIQTPAGVVANDPAMGKLSFVAHRIVIGLGNANVRRLVVQAMKSPRAAGAGLDLQDCSAETVVGQLFAAAERRGAGSAESICSYIGRLRLPR